MTPQEKAKELVEKFMKEFIKSNSDYWMEPAKQCALIAVEEIINNGRLISPLLWTSQEHGENYWQEVKKEIQILQE